jgi:S-adenosylmethionine:tRNA ribosyltransferase-isomerase
MTIKEYSFDLPEHLIAQYPSHKRGEDRLLVLDRTRGTYTDSTMEHFVDLLDENSLVVVNNSRVRKARLYGTAESGSIVEFLFLEEREDHCWSVMVSKAKKQRVGKRFSFGRYTAGIIEAAQDGTRVLDFGEQLTESFFEEMGHVPLPPYIRRDDTLIDESRYQTVYARVSGSVASPTAGLHFTPSILAALRERSIDRVELTLHVGAGTFLPVRTQRLEDHTMHWERYEISSASAAVITQAKREGRKIVAVGTTSVRTLESAWDPTAQALISGEGRTNLFIRPPYTFKVVDQLLTNFHTPESTLMVLVSTFATPALIKAAYAHAVADSYRFFSYGDAMFIR